MQQSPTLEINERCRRLESEGRNIFRLGLGQSPFPVPRPVVEELRRRAHEKDYLPVKGLHELRRAVADFHRANDGVDTDGENVLIGPGSKELMFLLQLTLNGELLVPSPCWVSYVPQARIIGENIHVIDTTFRDGWKITVDKLAKLYGSADINNGLLKLLILNYPGNPDGGTYSKKELAAIADFARERGIYVLSDEIYGRLHHENGHVSIARFYPERTIISTGISKWCGAGGWRLGTFTFPPELRWLLDAMADVASETYTSVCAPVQYAAVKAFGGGPEIDRYLLHARKILRALGRQCAQTLSDAGISVHEPKGGFYLFPDFTNLLRDTTEKHGITDSDTLCRRLLDETGVAILPGSAFERPEEELTTRIAYVNFDGARVLKASMKLGDDAELPPDFARKWCPDTIEAVERVAKWTKKLLRDA